MITAGASAYSRTIDFARMREIAVFQRRPQTTGLDEKAFYVPEKFSSLPEATKAMAKQEAYYKDYQDKRMLEAENIQSGEASGEKPPAPAIPEDDMLLQMTKDRLEAIYAQEDTTQADLKEAQFGTEMEDDDDGDGEEVFKDARLDEERHGGEAARASLRFRSPGLGASDPRPWSGGRSRRALAFHGRHA